MKNKLISITALALVFASCEEPKNETPVVEGVIKEIKKEVVYNTDDVESMLTVVANEAGGLEGLKALQDVEFDYHYLKPDGKKDVSKEKYIFEGEVSWAKYTIHEENVSPDLEGNVVQFYDGENYFSFNEGEALKDPQSIGSSQFLRQANYMWFTMLYKFSDPGVIAKYEGKEDVEGTSYDVVSINYDSLVTGKSQNDAYVLYINPETKMVESFKFSLPAFGVNAPVLLAKLTYTELNDIQVVTKRSMFAPNPEGGYVPMVNQVLENVKFNNGFTVEDLRKEI